MSWISPTKDVGKRTWYLQHRRPHSLKAKPRFFSIGKCSVYFCPIQHTSNRGHARDQRRPVSVGLCWVSWGLAGGVEGMAVAKSSNWCIEMPGAIVPNGCGDGACRFYFKFKFVSCFKYYFFIMFWNLSWHALFAVVRCCIFSIILIDSCTS